MQQRRSGPLACNKVPTKHQHVEPRQRQRGTSPCRFQGGLTLTLSSLSRHLDMVQYLSRQVLDNVKVSQLGKAVLLGTQGNLLQQLRDELGLLSSEQSSDGTEGNQERG